MSGRMARTKGARGERELAKFLRDRGYDAIRGRQYSGSPDSPDVICKELPFHWEVKRVERLQLEAALKQAIEDAGEEQIPIVAHKKNRGEWVAILKLEDLMELIKESKPQ